jgi:hypothetical protein
VQIRLIDIGLGANNICTPDNSSICESGWFRYYCWVISAITKGRVLDIIHGALKMQARLLKKPGTQMRARLFRFTVASADGGQAN